MGQKTVHRKSIHAKRDCFSGPLTFTKIDLTLFTLATLNVSFTLQRNFCIYRDTRDA